MPREPRVATGRVCRAHLPSCPPTRPLLANRGLPTGFLISAAWDRDALGSVAQGPACAHPGIWSPPRPPPKAEGIFPEPRHVLRLPRARLGFATAVPRAR